MKVLFVGLLAALMLFVGERPFLACVVALGTLLLPVLGSKKAGKFLAWPLVLLVLGGLLIALVNRGPSGGASLPDPTQLSQWFQVAIWGLAPLAGVVLLATLTLFLAKIFALLPSPPPWQKPALRARAPMVEPRTTNDFDSIPNATDDGDRLLRGPSDDDFGFLEERRD